MSLSTKEKILEVALDLFAKHGFNGTSIRDISQKAEVNVAAVNYHFKSKEGLFKEVITNSFAQMKNEIAKIYELEQTNCNRFVWLMYENLLKNGKSLLATYRMILSENLDYPQIETLDGELLGPPGGEYILKVITAEVGEDVPLKTRIWAMMALYVHIVYGAMMVSSSFGQQKLKSQPYYQESYKKKSTEFLVQSILNQVKAGPQGMNI